MSIIIQIAVGVLLFFGGFFTAWTVKPQYTIQNINNYTTQSQETTSIQNSFQGQSTVILNNISNQTYLNLNIAGATNIKYWVSTNSNYISITNK